MPIPLPNSIVDELRDPVSAMAAAFVIARIHEDLFAFVARVVCPAPAAPRRCRRRKAKAHGNGAVQPADDAYLERRRARRDRSDEALVETLRLDPTLSIGDLARAIKKSRTSCVSALHRLRAVGRAESIEGKWRLTEESSPREPREKWCASLSAAGRRAHAGA